MSEPLDPERAADALSRTHGHAERDRWRTLDHRRGDRMRGAAASQLVEQAGHRGFVIDPPHRLAQ